MFTYTKEHKLSDGKILCLKIGQDKCSLPPREQDTLGTIVTPLHLYDWEDYGIKDLIMDYTVPEGETPLEYIKALIAGRLKVAPSDVIVYPFLKHKREGVRLLMGDPKEVDYGACKFIFTTKSRFQARFRYHIKYREDYIKVKNIFQQELDDLSSWLNGEFFCYTIEQYSLGENNTKVGREFLAWDNGIARDFDFCKARATSVFEWLIKQAEARAPAPAPFKSMQ